MKKKVSVITINYNNLDGLKRTFDSVVNQTWQEFEYIIIDGGSIDGSKAFIERNKDKIDYWVSEQDKGIYNALNKGIQKATGDYLLFLNSGDHFYSEEVLANNLHHLIEHDIIAFDIHFLGTEYDKIGRHLDIICFSFLFEDTFAHQAVFIKRTLFDIVGLYDENLEIVADWKFFIQAIVYHKSTYKAIHEVLSTYYLEGISCSPKGLVLRKREREAVLKNEFSLFYDDYVIAEQNRKLLSMNRFKMLLELEKTYLGRKFSSLTLKVLSKFF